MSIVSNQNFALWACPSDYRARASPKTDLYECKTKACRCAQWKPALNMHIAPALLGCVFYPRPTPKACSNPVAAAAALDFQLRSQQVPS